MLPRKRLNSFSSLNSKIEFAPSRIRNELLINSHNELSFVCNEELYERVLFSSNLTGVIFPLSVFFIIHEFPTEKLQVKPNSIDVFVSENKNAPMQSKGAINIENLKYKY